MVRGRALWAWSAALAGLTLVRLLMAAWVPLTPDEAYYRIWALAPATGYLDHPPLVAVWIYAGMAVFGDTALGVRAMGPVSALAGTVLLALTARDWLRSRAQTAQISTSLTPDAGMVRTGLLLNGTVALGVGTLIMTPDTPLLLFMALLVWSLGRVCLRGQGAAWLLVGAAVGLGFESKYTAVLPVGGMLVWLFLTRAGRGWLKTPWPWMGGGVALLCAGPVIWWNATHGWVSFLKQGGRTGDWHPAKMVTYFGELLGGQIGLASPGVFVFFVGGVWLLWRQKDAFSRLLLLMILLPAVVFIQHAFGARVQANWPVVLYPALALAAVLPVWSGALASSLLGMALVGVIVVQAAFSPVTLSPHFDMTLRQMGGWQAFAQTVVARTPESSLLIADEYGLAAELSFYSPRGRKVMAVEPRWLLFNLPHARCGEGYLIRSHRRHDQPDTTHFIVLGEELPLVRARHGAVADTYSVFHVRMRCDAAGQGLDAVLLP
ncbi:glycosyltransferase family 39 protein [Acetobacter orleanensis]|uniref:Glycosyl transferase n=1 Tax=Acetobacter orleanensis TaxID=104099 RepID=A0A4Y3TPR0_9PROT|nr:glycosyltransferase family 39 protein [Acetobacter orleanensis]KXV64294.1 glycosyl transferase [Acetobacter orleanensis]PCD79077.1 glycosyl transferase [Acetobacter orleanensis]GAN69396.1 glycosyl/arabinosyl/mannosyl transferase [Acetobacter orleanensis JCM 7639]GBR22389.1 glycosyl/arabinosyl/mannosyl transferase [Acetobacter orleanensis NRIC 0473]GEB83000.1 glycosyl transferase [Acetobacter orleanensis]